MSNLSKRLMQGLLVGAAFAVVPQAYAVTVRLAAQSGGAQDAFARIIETFEAAHPDITIETEFHVVSDYPNIIRTQMRAGNGPDVFYGSSGTGYSNALYPLGEAGYLVDLADQPWVAGLQLPPGSENQFFWDGKLYAAPLNVVPLGNTYNAALLEELGLEPARTFDELLSQCDTAREQGKALIAESGVNAGSMFNNIAGSAVFAHDPEWNAKRYSGEVTFKDSPLWRDALERFVEMNNRGCFPDGAAGLPFAGTSPLVVGGQAVMRSSVAAVRSAILRLDPNVDLAFAVFPGRTEDETRLTVATTDSLGVNADSPAEVQAAALQFVAFLMEGDGAEMFADLMGNVSLSEAASGEVPEVFIPVSEYFSSGRTVEVSTIGWPNGAVYDALLSGLSGLMTGMMSVDDVLADMDAAWDQ